MLGVLLVASQLAVANAISSAKDRIDEYTAHRNIKSAQQFSILDRLTSQGLGLGIGVCSRWLSGIILERATFCAVIMTLYHFDIF